MALLPKTTADLITSVRDALQDTQKTRWPDTELFRYIDQAQRDIAVKTKYNHQVETIDVVDGTTDYTLNYQAIEFYSVTTMQHYQIVDTSTIKFKDSTPEAVVVDYYAYPERVVYGVTTSLTLDEDLYDALELYVLHKCYKKEDSTEHRSKAAEYKQDYLNNLSQHSIRVDDVAGNDVQPHKQDFV